MARAATVHPGRGLPGLDSPIHDIGTQLPAESGLPFRVARVCRK